VQRSSSAKVSTAWSEGDGVFGRSFCARASRREPLRVWPLMKSTLARTADS
jgi:hypothetical protein